MSSDPEASPELTLTSPMRNERQIFDLDSDEDMCLSPVSVVSSPVVASCVGFAVRSVQCPQPSESLCLDVWVTSSAKHSPIWPDLGRSGVAGEPVTARGMKVSGTRNGTKWKKRQRELFKDGKERRSH